MTPSTHTASAADHAAIGNAVRHAGSSFYWPMRLQPAAQRHAMFALYAVARQLDDIADGALPPCRKRQALADWRREIDTIAADASRRPSTPATRVLAELAPRFSLPLEELHVLIDGMERDSEPAVRLPNQESLQLYCRQVAGSIGLMSAAIFGRHDQDARDFALSLGEALQITNILRDLAEDAARDRCYVPEEVIRQHGVIPDDAPAWSPEIVLRHPALPQICEDLASLAEAAYAAAERALAHGGPRGLGPARAMMAIYHPYLAELRQQRWLSRPARRSGWHILRRLAAARFLLTRRG